MSIVDDMSKFSEANGELRRAVEKAFEPIMRTAIPMSEFMRRYSDGLARLAKSRRR